MEGEATGPVQEEGGGGEGQPSCLLPEGHLVPMRLDKFLSQFTTMSRSDIEAIFYADASRIQIRTGDVSRAASSLQGLVFLEDDRITVDGKEIDWRAALERQKTKVVALNKPAGAVSALKNTYGKKTLSDCLQDMPDGFGCVGRLDKETTGLLLFTNDGDLSHLVCKKGNRISKIYELTIGEPDLRFDDHRIQRILEGVDIYKDDEPAKATRITILPSTSTSTSTSASTSLPSLHDQSTSIEESEHKEDGHKRKSDSAEEADNYAEREAKRRKEDDTQDKTIVRLDKDGIPQRQSKKKRRREVAGTTKLLLEIQEGRNRVIRRMCGRVRLPLIHLHRLQVGNIHLAELGLEGKLGEWRYVPDDKVEELWRMARGRDKAVTRGQIEALAKRITRAREEEDNPTLTGANGEGGALPEGHTARFSSAKKERTEEELKRLENWFGRHGLLAFLEGSGS